MESAIITFFARMRFKFNKRLIQQKKLLIVCWFKVGRPAFLLKFSIYALELYFMKFILGKKLAMTQIWQGEEAMAVTKVQAGPCVVVQTKNNDKDKYQAVQIGYGERKEKNIKKPQIGHMKNLGNFKYLKEFRVESEGLKPGNVIGVSTFAKGDEVKVTGISKGRGFQGVVRRYGFAGSKKTHGNKDQLRMPGSIGATGPAHVFKGQKMPGRMGGNQATIKNLKIMEVDIKNNILLIKGAIPGARNGLLLISGKGDLAISKEDKKADTKAAKADSGADKDQAPRVKSVEILKKTISEPPKDSKKTEIKPETPEEVEKEVIKAKERIDKKATKENKK